MRALIGRTLRWAAIALIVAFLVSAAVPALSRSFYWLGQVDLGADEEAVRRRVLGDDWVDAVAALRRTIPADGEYALVNAEAQRGSNYWVRWELAPRRVRDLGLASRLPPTREVERRLPATTRWVVIAFRQPRPPLLLSREDFLRRLASEEAAGG